VSLSRPGVVLAVLTGLNGLNYLDRYVAAATLPLILADLALSDTLGGLLQSVFIITYSLACPVAGWLGDSAFACAWPRRASSCGAQRPASGLARPTLPPRRARRDRVGSELRVVTPSLLSDC
jgi:MFS family permease